MVIFGRWGWNGHWSLVISHWRAEDGHWPLDIGHCEQIQPIQSVIENEAAHSGASLRAERSNLNISSQNEIASPCLHTMPFNPAYQFSNSPARSFH
jgi:hypothetical protein